MYAVFVMLHMFASHLDVFLRMFTRFHGGVTMAEGPTMISDLRRPVRGAKFKISVTVGTFGSQQSRDAEIVVQIN